MKKGKRQKNLLAARVHPWQLFRFRRWVEISRKKPSIVLQEALQIYFNDLNLSDKIIKKMLRDYTKEKDEVD